MKRKWIIVLAAAMGFGFGSSAQGIVRQIPVPPKTVVYKPPKPGADYIWIDGHWKWHKKAAEYVWVNGDWIKDKPGKFWIPGSWLEGPGGYQWNEGYWSDKTAEEILEKEKERQEMYLPEDSIPDEE